MRRRFARCVGRRWRARHEDTGLEIGLDVVCEMMRDRLLSYGLLPTPGTEYTPSPAGPAEGEEVATTSSLPRPESPPCGGTQAAGLCGADGSRPPSSRLCKPPCVSSPPIPSAHLTCPLPSYRSCLCAGPHPAGHSGAQGCRRL
ncbi:hypothetical protein CALVIDRAFT_393206 [Calocera viscosa TUFC12733]|uniref:Uncharacterized protein n=1 Tax=Calocera viscosa (strain TUFC12733) TaxID=1330018 RepID=A0A167GEJ3_CALVF|nr:hypothetical protein CALVIDRAFT_393206 [Calocera viscosa TUFC12733]